ncbi:hypothetical protein [Actinokineospora enzanensis]|uniref:hypothetical protein n=1 Tax=Actinokineospora enzanensis TaxID=155975 RepID=UPI000379F6E2|nr:hypothetical protein [Actinokineospora enzanensis]
MRAALRVIAGRGAARAGIQLSLLALLPVWGADDFGRYVAAVGTFSWLQMSVAGVEKAALTAVPRARSLGGQVTWMLLRRAATPFVVTGVAAVALAPAGGPLGLYAAAAANAAGLGLLSVSAAIHRLLQRPGRDSVAFLAYAVWVVAAAALAFADVLRPNGYALMLTGGLAVVCAVLVALVPRDRPRMIRSGLSGVINRRVLLLGFSDVADAAGVSVLYILLAAIAAPAEAALVYVLVLISSTLGAFGVLVLRLIQPSISLRLRGPSGEGGRALARRVSGWTAVVAGSAALGIGAGALTAGADNRVLLGAIVAVEMTSFCAVVYAVFLLENTNGAVLSLTTAAALAALLATVATAMVATGPLGAIGAFLALTAGLVTKAAILHTRLSTGRGPVPVTTAG